MALFLAGLLTGLVEQEFANPRMGLAAHLEGVMNGAFLSSNRSMRPSVRAADPVDSVEPGRSVTITSGRISTVARRE